MSLSCFLRYLIVFEKTLKAVPVSALFFLSTIILSNNKKTECCDYHQIKDFLRTYFLPVPIYIYIPSYKTYYYKVQTKPTNTKGGRTKSIPHSHPHGPNPKRTVSYLYTLGGEEVLMSIKNDHNDDTPNRNILWGGWHSSDS